MLYDSAHRLIQIIENNGFEAYMVGGCVRDYLMHKDSNDIDITTSALPDELEVILDNRNIKYIETGIKHGTITVIFEDTPFEITTYRCDGEYSDNRHPENVEFVKNIDEDLARRDFTINAIAYNQNKGIVDLYGGQEDIENNLIRAVGDTNKRFKEDALRIMRAIRFASVLGFDIEENTKQAIFDNRELLKNVSVERIFTELKKLLLGKNVFNVLMEYREIIAVIIPEVSVAFDFKQNNRWHIYDVWEHTCKAVEAIDNDEALKLIMLFHDLGKPIKKTTDENGVDHFWGHQAASAEIAEPVLKRLKISNELLERILLIIPIHDLHIGVDRRNIKKWLSRLGEQGLYDLISVKKADKKAQNPELVKEELSRLDITKAELDRVIAHREPVTLRELDINGNDLLQLGFRGKVIGEILGTLLEKVIEETVENKNDVLIDYVKENW